MLPLATRDLLQAWDRGRDLHPVDQALLLRCYATPGTDPDAAADEALGSRNRALLELRVATFGRLMPAVVPCPTCGIRLELEVDAGDLLARPAARPVPVTVDGQRVRPLTSRDLATITEEIDPGQAALRLARACTDPGGADGVTGRSAAHGGTDVATPELGRIGAALEEADPWAELLLELACEVCGHAWSAPLDIAGFVWEEIGQRAGRLLDEVHVLASAYGWSEGEILALGEDRRAAYLQRVLA